MKINLKGKNAFVGGSSKGIGKAIAKKLAKAGANIFLVARDRKKLEKVLIELDQTKGQKHRSVIVDFSKYNNYSILIKSFFKDNNVDILVNNTQGPPSGGPLEKKIDDYQSGFDLLFKCAILNTTLALPYMQNEKWGRIINVSSISVKEPINSLVLSNSLRAALVTWAKSLSFEIGKDNITINNILTGYFDTERINKLNITKAKQLNKPVSEILAEIKNSIPLNRLGRPEEYANLVCFLASNEASYITGTNIPIDGGILKSF
tara:strand:+ start:2119 stop:2904 length:786 start_codon:yes stop_codon:yes gene_type:complete